MSESIESQLLKLRELIDTRQLKDAQIDKQCQDLEHQIRDSQRRKMLAKDKWHRELGEANE
jgi:hypothetical protein